MRRPITFPNVEGADLLPFILRVREQYHARPAYHEYDEGFRQVNSVRIVALQAFEACSEGEQLAIVADLLFRNGELLLARLDKSTVFAASDTAASVVVDLVCEVVWQTLLADDSILVEDELRDALTNSPDW